MRIPLGCVVAGLLLAAPARADICTSVDRPIADRAIDLIKAARIVLHDNWFAPLTVEDIHAEPDGGLYRVVINRTVSVDLAHVFIAAEPGDRARFVALGPMVGCDGGGPREVPGTAIAPAGASTPIVQPAIADDRPREQVVSLPLRGLLDLPGVALWGFRDEPDAPTAIAIYDRPDPAATPQQMIDDWAQLPYFESGYERPGAIVLDRRGDWYQVLLHEGTGWVLPAHAGRFRPYHELIAESLSYLEARWDGRLWSAPDRSADGQLMSAIWRNHMDSLLSADILETVHRDDGVWFRVGIRWPHVCGDESETIATGWVPGYASDGAPNLWFHSRGC